MLGPGLEEKKKHYRGLTWRLSARVKEQTCSFSTIRDLDISGFRIEGVKELNIKKTKKKKS
jgi:hypothetical protein